jgi:hypothetical protein
MNDMFERLGLRGKRCDGLFGVEIEMEGRNLPVNGIDEEFDKFWLVEHDGSLNADGKEYIFRLPLNLDDGGVKNALDVYKKNCEQAKAVLKPSFRAGVHTHYNIQKYSPLELLTLITTYYMLEDYFLWWSGPGRKGNHFCLGVKEAEAQIQKLFEACNKRDWRHLNTDNIRYAGLNLNAMFKHGSIEFRSMRSTADNEEILMWVRLIDQLAKGAKKFASPLDVITGVSQMNGDPDVFLKFVMEDLAKEFQPFKEVNIWENIHTVQPIAFLIDWKNFNREKVNPFL